jgi:hypothetical protein
VPLPVLLLETVEATLTFLPSASAYIGAFCLVTAPDTVFLGGIGIGSGAGGGLGALIETHILILLLYLFLFD